jgi:hypothetical protein
LLLPLIFINEPEWTSATWSASFLGSSASSTSPAEPRTTWSFSLCNPWCSAPCQPESSRGFAPIDPSIPLYIF